MFGRPVNGYTPENVDSKVEENIIERPLMVELVMNALSFSLAILFVYSLKFLVGFLIN